MKRITIGIPAYNAHNTLEQTLLSIAAQHNSELIQVIVVDDASKKGYDKIIKKFDGLLDIELVTKTTNGGPGLARAEALARCETDYVAFIDADDVFINNVFFHLAIEQLDKAPEKLIFSSTFLEEKEKKELTYHRPEELSWVHAKVYRVSFLQEQGITFSSSRALEDLEFNLRIIFLNQTEAGAIDHILLKHYEPSYIWKNATTSITRKNKNKFYLRDAPEAEMKAKIIAMDLTTKGDFKHYVLGDLIRYYGYAHQIQTQSQEVSKDLKSFYKLLSTYYTTHCAKYIEALSPEEFKEYKAKYTVAFPLAKFTVMDYFKKIGVKRGE